MTISVSPSKETGRLLDNLIIFAPQNHFSRPQSATHRSCLVILRFLLLFWLFTSRNLGTNLPKMSKVAANGTQIGAFWPNMTSVAAMLAFCVIIIQILYLSLRSA